MKIDVVNELRPCVVTFPEKRGRTVNGMMKTLKPEEKRSALFHHWSERFWTIGESALVGGYSAGQMSVTYGIVEYEDGSVHEVFPCNIRFIDEKVKEYCFEER